MAATKMTQSQMVKELAETTATNAKVAKQFMTSFAELAVRETKKNGMFVIPGIGRLVRVDRKARTGRNPACPPPVPVLLIFRPEHHFSDLAPIQCTRTHQAGLNRHADGCTGQAIIAGPARRIANRDDFRMSGRIGG